MRTVSIRSLALASLAALAMVTPSRAVTVLQFAQINPADFVTATAGGATTTLTTNSAAAAGSIPIVITNIAGTQVSMNAFETLIGVTSTGVATSAAGQIEQLYSGTIAITTAAGGAGGNFLTAAFTNATLSGLTGGGSASLVGSRPPQNVVFTSNFAAIIPLIAGNPPENFALSFSGIAQPPGLSLSGTTTASFTAQNTGTFATGTVAGVPEPASIVTSSTAILACLGCFGWRRFRSSRA